MDPPWDSKFRIRTACIRVYPTKCYVLLLLGGLRGLGREGRDRGQGGGTGGKGAYNTPIIPSFCNSGVRNATAGARKVSYDATCLFLSVQFHCH